MTDDKPEASIRYAPRENVEKFLNELKGERCWRCKFFEPSEEVTEDIYKIGNAVIGFDQSLHGWCRRYPPTSASNLETGEIDSVWPWVSGRDWCGEFVECERSVDDFTRRPAE